MKRYKIREGVNIGAEVPGGGWLAHGRCYEAVESSDLPRAEMIILSDPGQSFRWASVPERLLEEC